jgi:chemotaxis protein MotB
VRAGVIRKRPEKPSSGAPLWVLTYGDVMSLCLCFFVMLQAYSTLEIEKFNQAMSSLKGALGVLPYQQSTSPMDIIQQRPSKGERKTRGKRTRAAAALNKVISENKLGKMIKVTQSSQGVHITIGDPALFESGKADIKPAALPVLQEIVRIIGTGDESIRVEGHTDNVPIHTAQFGDNWELSIGRAMAVVKYFRSRDVIDPGRLRPVGCGEFHPLASNETEAGRSMNRRVEIYIDMSD